jgi:hypothetical protein
MPGKEAGHKMAGVKFSEFGFTLTAGIPGIQAARIKTAARGRVYGAGNIAF